MSTKDAKKLFIVTGGAVKSAPSNAPMPTGPNFVFDPAIWADQGALKTQPSLNPTANSTTVTLWNLDDVTVPGSDSWTLTYGAAQLDYEVLKQLLNFDVVNEDGSVSPGDTAWEGQLAVFLTTAKGVALIHIPNATLTDKGNLDFVKKDATEASFTYACNPDSRIDGKPYKLWLPGGITPETVPAP